MLTRTFKRRVLKATALFFVVNIIADCVFPTVAWALTSGPAQPEYSSFEPVTTTNMVNEFGGDFTYNLPVLNIPGPNGAGYAMSLAYHSGVSQEEEASWVGYGWTLNPGAVNRGKQGIPDDFKADGGDVVNYWNQTRTNRTVSVSPKASMELYSFDLPSITPTIRYNNYRGFGTQLSVSVAAMGGLVNLDYTVSGESPHSFSAELNTAALLQAGKAYGEKSQKKTREKGGKKNKGGEAAQAKREKAKGRKEQLAKMAANSIKKLSSTYGLGMFGKDERASSATNYSGFSVNTVFTLGPAPSPLHFAFEFGGSGSYTEQSSQSVNQAVTGALYSNAGGKDYTVEKQASYNKRDRYLSIPHQAPDAFQVSGEGVSGTFKLVNPNIGNYTPNSVNSQTVIMNSAVDITLGLNFGIGFNLGVGVQSLSEQGFNVASGIPSIIANNKPFFRFTNDLGGNLIYSQDTYENNNNSPSIGSIASVYLDRSHLQNLKQRPGATTAIGYATMSDRNNTATYSQFRAPICDAAILGHVTSNAVLSNRIAELYTVNESGNTYVYGLPVFSADEKEISFNANFSDGVLNENNHLIWRDAENNFITKVGQEQKNLYSANTHLLTQITTPDFIDRTLNGPTQDDFGGWTKFNYRPADFMVSGGNDYTNKTNSKNGDKWYNWRMPYNGLYYNKGEISDARDDMGSMQSGKKEIYYLKTIETKTHVAYFITNKTNVTITSQDGGSINLIGSGTDRMDGCSAADDVTAAKSNLAMNAAKKLEKLERIVVYAKPYDPASSADVAGKPLSTVHFDYFAEGAPEVLVKNLPNSAYTSGGVKGGKLTLRRVWFEHEGVVNAKIAPYEFKYEYKDLATDITNTDLTTKYPEVMSFATELSKTANKAKQNPNYVSTQTDGWGGFLPHGATRSVNMQPWLDQSKILKFGDVGYDATVDLYDPAAWQLKQIKLPSGGLILVQYEQHDYQYVQNQRALAMVRLKSGSNGDSDKFYLRIDDIDLSLTDPAIDDYVTMVNKYLSKEKLYFKFLYTLMENSTPTPENCAADYIDGYVSATAGKDGTGVFITIQTPSAPDANSYPLPKNACKSFVTRRKAGLSVKSDCSNPEENITSDPLAAVKSLLQRGITDLNAITNNSCPVVSSDFSYIRVPTFHAKRAGGVRVKRILMYDQGLEANSDVLYGTEYFYQNEDGTSSGVATNEPNTFRMENALVVSLQKRNSSTWAERVISGNDKDNFEGPLGESLLPSPSIGYSRVVTQNIHTGKTGTGFRVSQFYTAKDYPIIAKASDVDQLRPFPVTIPAIVVNIKQDERSAAQGYQFITNNMHGKQKRVATFGGQYVAGTPEINYVKSFEEINDYYEPGEKVSVMDETGLVSTPQYLGREESITIEAKQIRDEIIDASVQVDPSGGIFGPYILPQLSFCPYFTYELRTLKTTVINKTISYTAIPKRTTTTQDGIVHVTENKVFSKYTGTPVVTATYDGYDQLTNLYADGPSTTHDGTYLNYAIPAHLVYPNMGQENRNLGIIVDGCSFNTSSKVLTIPTPPAGVTGRFIKGDLVRISTGVTGSVSEVALGAVYGMYYVSSVSGLLVTLQPLTSGISPLYAPVYTYTGSGTISGIRAEVLNSGYTNQLNQVSAKISTYGNKVLQNPISSGNIGSMNNVFSASVDTYSDDWSSSLLENSVVDNYSIYGNAGDFQAARKGKWRLKSNYAYKTDTKDAYASASNKVYTSAGNYTSAFTGFNYATPPDLTSSTWIRTNMVNIYSPDGNALEEQNSMGVKSTALFGHKENVPVLIAKNASYGSSAFVSFEDQSTDTYVSNAQAHSGKQSLQLSKVNATKNVAQITVDNLVQKQGLQFKFWVKSDATVTDDLNQYLTLDLNYNSVITRPRLTKIAKVGDWVLYEGILRDLPVTGNMTATLTYSGSPLVWFDDIRIQPYEAQMTCYVYDRSNFRLIASFDDQHFGLFYQYNAEGKLVRKLIETERGMKTISETQYNTPVVAQ